MNEFPFDEGDSVLVRARENGTTGKIEAKFVAECFDIRRSNAVVSPTARLRMPFGNHQTVSMRPYEAEFERLDDPADYTF